MVDLELAKLLVGELEWQSGPIPEDAPDGLGNPYLCVVEWGQNPLLLVCYISGGSFMLHDDLSLCGPVKCVSSYAAL